MTTVNPAAVPALEQFDATTARWGRLTMIAGLLFALAGPAYLVLFSGLDVARPGSGPPCWPSPAPSGCSGSWSR